MTTNEPKVTGHKKRHIYIYIYIYIYIEKVESESLSVVFDSL